jgi:hypothetical protein
MSGTARPAHGEGDAPPELELELGPELDPPELGGETPGSGTGLGSPPAPDELLEPPPLPPDELPEPIDGSGAMAPEQAASPKPPTRRRMYDPTTCARCIPRALSRRRAIRSIAPFAKATAV